MQNGCECIGCLPSQSRGCHAQCHERGLHHVLLAQEEIKIQKFEVQFLLHQYCFCTSVNLKNHATDGVCSARKALVESSPHS